MRIAVLGAGAMGSLFGGYLSRMHDVLLVDVNEQVVGKVNSEGVVIHEPDGSVWVARPRAYADTEGLPPVDLVIVFVKAMFSESALEHNKGLIGSDTFVMTLQNGSGHEDTLCRFVDRAHVVIGTTQHNSAVVGMGEIRHGGSGLTHIGCIEGDVTRLQFIADALSESGLEADCDANVLKLIWNKMFTNVSASVLTAVLQEPLGFIASDAHAWALCETLIREAVAVARGEGLDFDVDEKIAEVRAVCENSPQGLTSIYADLQKGRRTEVDTISGSIVRAGRRNGVPAPTHEAMVALVHAMEDRAVHG